MAFDQFLKIGDLQFHVQEWGDSRSPLIVLLHGLASTSHMFDLIAPALGEYFHVVAPDQRGHGLSDKPASGYDFETISRDFDGLLDAYGVDQAILFGHSWGAYTTLYYAATRPDRIGKAGLIDGGIRLFSEIFPTWAEAEQQMSPPAYVNRTLADIERMIEYDWLGAAYRPELLPLALSVFDTSDPNNVHAHLCHANHMQIARAIWEIHPYQYYLQVECPLLSVNAIAPGEDGPDVQIQANIAEAEELIGDVQVVWMPETIHDIPWQRPVELLAIMEQFLLPTS
ncbi:MAG: alpha/beta fold hydrolase [Chloroflexi bacterium]|nr:alpha/beta fold hydrolase [Chloroflexota bacterium]